MVDDKGHPVHVVDLSEVLDLLGCQPVLDPEEAEVTALLTELVEEGDEGFGVIGCDGAELGDASIAEDDIEFIG